MTRFVLGPDSPVEHNSRVPLILGVTISLFSVSFLVWTLRLYTRYRLLRKFWWDDFFISVAMLFSIASCGICVANVVVGGYGQHTLYLTPETVVRFAHLALVAEPLWVWEVTFIKISVASMFLRFARSLSRQMTWRVIMYFSIFYLFASASIVLVLQMTECKPLRFYWNQTVPGGYCRSPQEVRTGIIATSVVFAFSDFQFSLLPLTFIVTLRRPLRERIAMACLMALGLLASIVGCLKFIGFNNLDVTTDPTYVMVIWKMGSLAEAKLGMIAANMPPLKSWGEDMLGMVLSRASLNAESRSTASGMIWAQQGTSGTESTWKSTSEESRSNSNQGLIVKAMNGPELTTGEV